MKRWLLILLCGILLFSYTGCNKNREIAVVYTDIPTEYSMGNISVTYPRLAGQVDGTKIPMVNHLIKTDILERVFDDSLYQLNEVTATIQYTITLQNSSLISLVYTGTLQANPQSEVNRVIYTVTFDLENGQEIPFSQAVNNPDALESQIAQAAITAADGVDAAELEAYRPALKKSDLLLQYDQNSQYTFSMTEEGLFLSFPVPHSLGDYATITIDN